MDAQQQQDQLLSKNSEALMRLSPSRMKQEIAASGEQSAASSSSARSSLPTGLVEAVMQKHGFTREQAEEELAQFGA